MNEPLQQALVDLESQIDALRRSQAALRESESRIKSISNNFTAGMIYQVVMSPDGTRKFTYLSDSVRQLYGISPDEGMADATLIYSRVHEDDIALLRKTEDEALETLSTFQAEVRIHEPSGEIRWSSLVSTPQRMEDGSISWDGIEFIITERKRMEETLRIQHDLSLALNSCSDLRQGLDKVLKAALQFESIDSGGIYVADPVSGELDLVAHHGLSQEFIARVSHYAADSPNVRLASTGNARYGSYTDILPTTDDIRLKEGLHALAVIPVMSQGQLIALLNLASHSCDSLPADTRSSLETLALQIGSSLMRLRTDAALRESEEKYRSIVETTAEWIWEIDLNGRHTFSNLGVTAILGYRPEELIGQIAVSLLHAEDRPKVETTLPRLVAEKRGWRGWILRWRHKDGSYRFLESNAEPILDSSGHVRGYRGSDRDITERKQAEEALRESEEKYRGLVEQSLIGIGLSRRNQVIFANPALLRIFGYDDLEEFARTSLLDHVAPASRDQIAARLRRVAQGEIQQAEFEYDILRKDGETKTLYACTTHVTLGGEIYTQTVFQDITERVRAEEARRQAEEQIRTALAEKETLLRELYHRTKNNMQVIIALLKMQASSVGDARLEAILKDIQNRIHSMALVHQKLYEARDLSRVNLKEYVGDLTQFLMASHELQPGQITLTPEMEDVFVLIDTAIPCGLILNELLSNVFKHAFPAGRQGEIRLQLGRTEDGEIQLRVADNGVGVPAGFDFRRDGHLGLRILFVLAETQLGGQVDFDVEQGVSCQIRFRDESYQPRI